MTKQVKKYAKQIILLLILAVESTFPVKGQTPTPTPTPTQMCAHTGDVTGDMLVTSVDAQQSFSIALHLYTPTYEESCAADCNGDQIVSSGDAQAIFRKILEFGECMDPLEEATPPIEFVYIPAGTFQMGSPDDEMCRYSDEGPVHSVTLTHAFYIQSTEVTQQQWIDVFGENPSEYTGLNRPVENVTWYDCCIYCNRLSQSEGLTPCYYSDESYTTVFDGTPPVTYGSVYWNQSANGYRLPTEAEWEYACRAGTTTVYNNGENNADCAEDPNLDPLGRYYFNSGSFANHAVVGSYQANNWGLYDMHGNVWEWCWDRKSSDYSSSSSPCIDPTGPTSGPYCVMRGGGWIDYASCCRSAVRRGFGCCSRRIELGFRPLRIVP